jgi:hypothetical protein
MQRAGVRIITWGFGGATAHASDTGWRGGDEFDYQALDDAARMILKYIPDVWLIPRIAATAPAWWMRQHPDQLALTADGRSDGSGMGCGKEWADDPRQTTVSQASDAWQHDCEFALKKLVEHIDQVDWGERCIGLQPNGGVNEWFVGHGHEWTDYSPLARDAYRAWLAQRGEAGAATAEIPLPEALSTGTWGGWNDPSQSRSNELYWRFYHELNARRMQETCAAVKDASGNRLLVGGFYGYIGDSYSNKEPVAWLYGHHHDLRDITEHPAIDFLAAPYSYQNRQPGGTPESQIPTASCDLANCFTFTENDLGTFWSVEDESEAAIARSLGTMIRDQGQRIIRRQGFWWMDLLRVTSDWKSDWYTHPMLEKIIHQLTTLQATEASRPATTWHPEIAVVLANDTPFYAQAGHQFPAELVTRPLRDVLPALGAPMDVLMLDDLAREKMPKYKLFLFLDIPCVTPAQRALIHRRLSEQQATAYFQGVPGLIDGKQLDPQLITELVGMQVKPLGWAPASGDGRRASVRFSNFSHEYVQGVSPSHTIGGQPVTAACFITDPDATILATMSLKGRPGMAVIG